MDGAPLVDGRERSYDGQAQLVVPGIGVISLRSNRTPSGDMRLEQVEEKRRALLGSMGVETLAAAGELDAARWNMAHADLALMLMRLAHTSYPLPDRVQAFLDASPLRAYLAAHLPLAGVAASIARGDLYALAVTATSYHSGRSFTFIQGRPGHPLWLKSRRVTLPVEIDVDHVCASASIPIVFPPVRVTVEGRDLWFGDGGLRLVNPLSPAIRLGLFDDGGFEFLFLAEHLLLLHGDHFLCANLLDPDFFSRNLLLCLGVR